MKLLNATEILDAPDLPNEVVEVPEWGGSVLVRGLTGEERDAWEKSMLVQKGKKIEADMEKMLSNARARLCALCMVDEEGNRLFTEAQIPLLGKKSAQALDRVFKKAQELSGITEKDMDELTEGLKENPSAASSSNSA